jgi:hypothetical protein
VDEINQEQLLRKGEVMAEQEKRTKNILLERETLYFGVPPAASFPLTRKVCYKVEKCAIKLKMCNKVEKCAINCYFIPHFLAKNGAVMTNRKSQIYFIPDTPCCPK